MKSTLPKYIFFFYSSQTSKRLVRWKKKLLDYIMKYLKISNKNYFGII